MKKRHLLSLLALGISTACYGEIYPAPIGPSQSDFGGVGLLQTPTARMAREGELSLNYRDNDQYRYYSASVQLFPWLETTLRYTDVRTRQYSSVEAFSGDQTYKDKAFDLKLRLWEESYWLPQVAVGARDIGGTGLFDAEYLVASKAWGPFDFTLGLGWGYLGTSGNERWPGGHSYYTGILAGLPLGYAGRRSLQWLYPLAGTRLQQRRRPGGALR